MATCELCVQPRKPRKGHPGQTYHLCIEHYAEYMRQQNKASYLRHKEAHLRRTEAYQKKEEIRAYNSARQRQREIDDPARRRAEVRRRDHLKKSAQGFYTEIQWLARLAFYGWRCYLCDCDWSSLDPFDQTIDHVIPISKGGSNWPSNLRPACRSCNSRKSDQYSSIPGTKLDILPGT